MEEEQSWRGGQGEAAAKASDVPKISVVPFSEREMQYIEETSTGIQFIPALVFILSVQSNLLRLDCNQ